MEIDWKKGEDGGYTAQWEDYQLSVELNDLDGYWGYSVAYFGTNLESDSGCSAPRFAQDKAVKRIQKHIKNGR